ncbi:MAG: hypothetical protein JXA30_20620 [Deltaproteobacteria bacterium]|nr:hypothetical protein [Deltaproteobacteria bacterium]
MKALRFFYLSTVLIAAIALINLNSGCELVTEFDRGKILDGPRDSGTSEPSEDTGAEGDLDAQADAEGDAKSDDSAIDSGRDADAAVECTEAADCGEPSNDCLQATCIDNRCGVANKDKGARCDSNGGEVCDGEGACVAAACIDGLINGDETDLDCGGGCPACENGRACITYKDCESGFCQGGLEPDEDASVVDEPVGQCAPCGDDDDCADMEDSWCDSSDGDGTCVAKKSNGSECENDNECLSGACQEDHDGEGEWCADPSDCVHDGDSYDDGDFSDDCYDSTSRAVCDDGSWAEDSCGSSDCEGTCGSSGGCEWVARGCAGNECFEEEYDSDDNASYCTGCLSADNWLANATGATSKCCGDDQGEDFEQSGGAGNCCYNAAVLATGSVSGSILCHNGLLYDCGAIATDDSDLAQHSVPCEEVGGLFCTGSNAWAQKAEDGCPCSGNGNCSSNYCRENWSGSGNFCAQDATSCVYREGSVTHQRANAWVECAGGDGYRVCNNGVWDPEAPSSATACGDDVCDIGCGYVLDADNICQSGQGSEGGCEPDEPSDCRDCGDLTAHAGGCNTETSACSSACGSPVCTGIETNDSGIDYCSAGGDSYNRIDICAVLGSGSAAVCDWDDDGTANDTLNDECDEYACEGAGVCRTTCEDNEDCASGFVCASPPVCSIGGG